MQSQPVDGRNRAASLADLGPRARAYMYVIGYLLGGRQHNNLSNLMMNPSPRLSHHLQKGKEEEEDMAESIEVHRDVAQRWSIVIDEPGESTSAPFDLRCWERRCDRQI
jgi:hypothetical protein